MSRFDFQQHFAALQPLFALGKSIRAGSLEPALRELVDMRVSQINGCAFCLDMHSKDARAAGETEQRLYLLPAWRETALYSPRERAALAWAEALTRLGGHDAVPDALHEEVRAQFSEEELVQLTLLVTLINGWNRLNIAARTEAGGYRPGMFGR
ncbi:carboxymuconolactone decarboxylase family protein [Fulvimonas soli]|jgi:AhpD family alkylhydroperoxidase|uniref:AhpD family alkylhydroperoxidase n=1 Tax=Fulvimonas soli TaxID=155197 RepID=A0A316IGX2_9GAMM|nr:carboxymuconolactone decarboxylase family protein [Fulvimonas soli]PWK92787.1 AhpD family alkylhydroperoxidase [Fulvimonas soli]TNY28061.1 carboxymuconolactone decarboxylase [Fulvimonas soli]